MPNEDWIDDTIKNVTEHVERFKRIKKEGVRDHGLTFLGLGMAELALRTLKDLKAEIKRSEELKQSIPKTEEPEERKEITAKDVYPERKKTGTISDNFVGD